jgi:hypothetical protein
MHVSLVTIATYVTDTKKGRVLEAEANAAVNGQKAKKYIYNLAEVRTLVSRSKSV